MKNALVSKLWSAKHEGFPVHFLGGSQRFFRSHLQGKLIRSAGLPLRQVRSCLVVSEEVPGGSRQLRENE